MPVNMRVTGGVPVLAGMRLSADGGFHGIILTPGGRGEAMCRRKGSAQTPAASKEIDFGLATRLV